jgi:hypothetical protein
MSFKKELRDLLNKHSKENGSNTPDFILAKYLVGCLDTFNAALQEREKWYGRGSQVVEEVPEGLEPPSPPPIVPAIPHDDLRVEHRIFEEEELAGLKAHYRADLLTPEGEVTAPGIIFHKGSPVEGWHGWTTAHVIRALITHMEYHQTTKFACDQNDEILEHLRDALKATERRRDDRQARGVLYDTEKP